VNERATLNIFQDGVFLHFNLTLFVLLSHVPVYFSYQDSLTS